MAEILCSRKRVHASYYKDGKFTHGDEHASLFGVGLADKCVQEIVVDAVRRLLNERLCGFVVEPPLLANDDTIIRVYRISPNSDGAPLWYDIGRMSAFDIWLLDFFETYQVKRAMTEAHARTGYEPPDGLSF